jgi:hypothetical protein
LSGKVIHTSIKAVKQNLLKQTINHALIINYLKTFPSEYLYAASAIKKRHYAKAKESSGLME